jgi:epoxyqueuosine reductase QueG
MDHQSLAAFARQAGADVFGIANIERFDELPADKHPRAIFPEARSVIVVGRRIPRGALRGVEEGTQFQDYLLYGCDWLDNRFVAMTTFHTAEFLENDGWEAVPLPNLPPEVPPMGVAVRKGAPAPNVMLDFDDAAVRAGVGEIGYCGTLLTPRFGPRQRVQAILTDAALEPSPILQEAICPRDGRCGAVCPLGAMGGEREITICGKTMKLATIDRRACSNCKNGALPNRYHGAGKPDRLAAVCTRTCVDFLEREGRVDNRFDSEFRKRPAWTVGRETDLYRL